MNAEAQKKVVEYAIHEAQGLKGVNRGKAFKLAFDRVEAIHGKAMLDDSTKRNIRNAIDDKLKELAAFKKCEVIQTQAAYKRLNADLEIVEGRRIVTLDTTQRSVEEEVVTLHGMVFEIYGKLARQENGASDSQLKQIDRIKKAINSRLFNLNQSGELSEQMQKISAYVNRTAQRKAQEVIQNATQSLVSA